MFEILQPTQAMADNAGISSSCERRVDRNTLFDVDRATIVTADIERALAFYAKAFGWQNVQATTATLSIAGTHTRMRRFLGTAGKLQLELIEPDNTGDDPYAAHLRRGHHGLIHAGGVLRGELPSEASLHGEWLETAEPFALYDWPGGERALQIRHTSE
jgi:catechol 2,3-dioxygenase-like lactoylglutathione lyase family enzyme